MIPEIGRFALFLALTSAIAQAVLPLAGATRRDERAMGFADAGRRGCRRQLAYRGASRLGARR